MSDPTTTRVGFIGLGNIGKPMALRLASQASSRSLALSVYDVAAEPLAELAAAGAQVASSVAALAADVDVLCVMVRDDDQVRDVLGEVLGRSERDGDRLTVVVHSTVAPTTPGELATTAARHGVRLVDAPVSGGSMGASAGTLAIMVGGSDDAFATVRPVLDAMASLVVHAGPIGAGTTFKLARNLMHFVAFTAATEAQRLAEAAGLDLKVLGDVVRHTDAITGGPGAIMHRETAAPIAEGDFWHGVFTHVRALGEKDLGFATDLADQLGVEVPLARLALERLGPGLGLEEHDPPDTEESS
ncbi:putative dehydrogenase/reductase [Nocardioides psychrotolerans]|uniref:3-hydroxyisobutyrate dehydrogenase n=1 Tax=Nocardioides psychrotolerans TaxID=1005945 RepID=A0A1I3R1E0_9ACTN|nr:NAD(P)-dependent oxidoreductase [Nocardioides psychrotolerans]GEP40307.1 putative dehydrogenase/reductase [Nocardioides psychrotolerans]SFJ40373.1 3-hydroxyisobutyrate dehydrogenase [Nocardioides psychrotolerans]